MPAFVRIVDHPAFADHFRLPGEQSRVADRAGITLARINQLVRGVSLTVPARTGELIEAALGLRTGSLFQPDDPEVLRRYLANRPCSDTVHSGRTTQSAAPPDPHRAD